MIQKSSVITRLSIMVVLLSLSPAMGWGQSSTLPASGARRGKSHQQTCDGALDIVPAKAMTFARKRKPAPKTDAPANESRQNKG